jgi:hypothetical protein
MKLIFRRKKVLKMDPKKVTEKKPYTPPELIEYGDLVEITGSGNLNAGDAVPLGSQPEG